MESQTPTLAELTSSILRLHQQVCAYNTRVIEGGVENTEQALALTKEYKKLGKESMEDLLLHLEAALAATRTILGQTITYENTEGYYAK